MVLTFTTPSLARLNKKSIPPILLVVLAAIILFHQRNSVSGLVLLPFQTSRPLETNPVQYSWEREANIAETNAPTTDPSYPIFKSVSRGNLIPNRILRTWKTSSVEEIKQMSLNGSDHPERIVWFENWSKMNPRAIQVVLSDADMDPFVRGAFTKRVVDAFFKLPRMILRADFLRYMMLYELGGVYTDMDTSCNIPIYKWNLGLEGVAVIVGVEDPGYHNDEQYGKGIDSIQQWTMASARHHPFMGKVIDAITNKIHSMTEKELLDADVLELTGPGIWKKVVYEHLKGLGADLEATAHLWGGYKLYGDFLVVGKHYLNNDNPNNPKSFIRHHFTGFSSFGWRVSGNTLANETREAFAKEQKLAAVRNSTAVTKSKAKVSHLSAKELDEEYNWKYSPLLDSLERSVSQLKQAKIPKVIFQVSNTSSPSYLPMKYQERRNSWVALNSDYKVKLFSDGDMDRYVYYKCSTQEKTAYYHLPLLRQRVALFSLLYLLHNGGVYAEIDTLCRVPIKYWIFDSPMKQYGLLIGFKDQHHNPPSYQHLVVAAKANHPIIADFVKTQTADIILHSQKDFESRIDFNDYFRGQFNKHMNKILEQGGFNPSRDFKQLSWHGRVEYKDVLILGSERFSASNMNNIVSFVSPMGGLWNDIWREETLAKKE